MDKGKSKPILDALKVRAMYFLADAYYGNRVEVPQKAKELGIKAIVPIRDSLHKIGDRDMGF